MRYLSIAAVFKHENPWLVEWIEYHRQRGVEHFYLFNNEDDTTSSDLILKPYVDSGLVDNIHFPGLAIQMPAYIQAMKKARFRSRWLAFIDLDEFILPRKTDDIRDLLSNYEKFGGLAINWHIFGSSGLVERPKSQIDFFLHRAESRHEENVHVKTIVQPLWARNEVINPHFVQYHRFAHRFNRHTVNENGQRVDGPFSEVSTEFIRINHYRVRSRQDFQETKLPYMRADVALGRGWDYFEKNDINEVYDDEIKRRFGAKKREG